MKEKQEKQEKQDVKRGAGDASRPNSQRIVQTEEDSGDKKVKRRPRKRFNPEEAGPDHLRQKPREQKKINSKTKKPKKEKSLLKKTAGVVGDILISPASNFVKRPLSQLTLIAGVGVPLVLLGFAAAPATAIGCVAFSGVSGAFYAAGNVNHFFERRKERREKKAAIEREKREVQEMAEVDAIINGKKKNSDPEPGNGPKPGAKPKIKGQGSDGQKAKPASGPAKPGAMDGSALADKTGKKRYWDRPTRQTDRMAKAAARDAAKEREAEKKRVKKVAENFLKSKPASPAKPAESFRGGELEGGKQGAAPATPTPSERKKRTGPFMGRAGK